MGQLVATIVSASGRIRAPIEVVLIFVLPPIILHLMGCGFLLLFEKTLHPWRQLDKERESHCWGKLQGTKKGIVAEPTVWEQEVAVDELENQMQIQVTEVNDLERTS